ncbi:MAG: hypothetical protein QOJ11_3647 [Frankiales bacterium]|jgi:hypothetical protein|nr:hypothetical protein [Frankiales bacterium]
MISSVVVTYQVKPESVEEHLRLVRAVFEELAAASKEDVAYKVFRLQDGVSFVHVSTSDTPDGASPLPQLASFREFGRQLADRVATPPLATPADVIGSYEPGGAAGTPR